MVALALICASCASGCLARKVTADGVNLRQALIDMYTDQAFDNLIRAHENRLFVQLSYSQLSVVDKDAVTGSAVGGEADLARGRATDLTKSALAAFANTTNYTGKFPLGLSGQRDRILSFHADPVTDKNYIYDAYRDFAHNSGLFVVSDRKPTCDVHIARKCGCNWYWIPREAGGDFLQLVIRTSFLPAPPAPAEVAWETSIKSIDPAYDKDGNLAPNRYVITLTKDVPNDDGLLQVTMKDKKPWLRAEGLYNKPFEKGKAKQQQEAGLAPGVPTKTLYVRLDTTMTPADTVQLAGSAALFLSQHYPNPSPRPGGADTQKVLDLLDNIRIQLTKTNFASP
ncbi:MAG TPA: hypothetical protein VFE62_29180 [Gemmataceae bacterium]|nr:hypothetical protein [Gemmataceae bacterium]